MPPQFVRPPDVWPYTVRLTRGQLADLARLAERTETPIPALLQSILDAALAMELAVMCEEDAEAHAFLSEWEPDGPRN